MKDWRIHSGWAIVTVLTAVVATRLAAPREVPAAPPRASSTAPVAAVPAPEASRELPVALPDAAPARPPAPTVSEDRVTAILLAGQNWDEFRDLLKGVTDRQQKLALVKRALASENTMSVSWGMLVLADLKGRDSAELLEALLRTHPQSDIRSSAAVNLGTVGDPGSLGPLTEALRSTSEPVRVSSAYALMKLGFQEPAQQMLAAYAKQYESPDGSVRRRAIEWMIELHPQGALPILTRALRDTNGDVRQAAVEGFWQVDKPEYLPLLEPLLNDPNPDVARKARELAEEWKKADR